MIPILILLAGALCWVAIYAFAGQAVVLGIVIIGVALASGLGWWLHTQAWRS
jgi:hypothetical protein